MKQRTTMKDVAREAGVHPSTVSRALSGRGRVSVAECARIRAVAERLGFVPDPVIGRLCAYRHGRITSRSSPGALFACVTDYDECHGGEAEVLVGFDERCAALGCMTARWPGDLARDFPRLRRSCQVGGVDGLFVAVKTPISDTVDWRGLRAVWMGADAPVGVPSVLSNMSAAMRWAFRKAVDMGYRRIGAVLFIGPIEERAIDLSGTFLHLQHRASSDMVRIPPLFLEGRDTPDEVARAFVRWLDAHRPDALIGHSALFHHLATLAGRRIPEDLAFLSLTASRRDPAVAGIDCRFDAVGHLAAETLHLLFRAGQTLPLPESMVATVQPEWHAGASLPETVPSP